MTKTQSRCLTSWSLCLTFLIGCHPAATTAPQKDGKTLREWVDVASAPLAANRRVDSHHRYLRANEQRQQALKNIQAFGADAIPALMDLCEHEDRSLRADASRILSQIGEQISPEAESVIPLIVTLREHTSSDVVKRWTITVLTDISTGTTPVSAMMTPLSDRTLRSAVVIELAQSDWWINGLTFSKKPIDALQTIAYPSTPGSSPQLAYADVAKLHDQALSVKTDIIGNEEVKRLSPVAELIEQAKSRRSIMYALQGLQHYAQAGAAVSGLDLGTLNPDLSAAIPVLEQILESGHRGNATRAIKILGLIGPEAKASVPKALEMLNWDYYDARAEAAAALGGFGDKDRKIIQSLIESVEQEWTTIDGQVRPHRGGTGMGRGMRSQLPPGTLRANVAVALGRLAAHPDLSVPTLVEMLDLTYMGSSERCDLATIALKNFGTDAKVAIPDLVNKLRSKPMTQPALTTLRDIDPDLENTVSILVKKLENENGGVQLHAILVLALLRSESRSAMESLEAIAASDDATASSWAAYALWKIAPATHSLVPAIPVLAETLEAPETRRLNKLSVLSDLASLGADAAPALPAIVMAIERGDFGKKRWIAYLKKISPETSVNTQE